LGIYPKAEDGYDFDAVGEKLAQLKARYPDKTDASILLEQEIPYDTLVQIMDTVRISVEVEVGENDVRTLVRSDLFPDISIGDAPLLAGGA